MEHFKFSVVFLGINLNDYKSEEEPINSKILESTLFEVKAESVEAARITILEHCQVLAAKYEEENEQLKVFYRVGVEI